MAHVLKHCSVNHFLSSTADHVPTSGGESSRPEESHDLASPRNNASGKEAMSPDIVLEGRHHHGESDVVFLLLNNWFEIMLYSNTIMYTHARIQTYTDCNPESKFLHLNAA